MSDKGGRVIGGCLVEKEEGGQGGRREGGEVGEREAVMTW